MRRSLACAMIGVLAMLGCRGDAVEPFSGDAGDAGADVALESEAGGVNLLFDGEFEKPDCYGWTPNAAIATSDTDARSGKTSCKVCPDGSTTSWGIFQRLDASTLVVGTSYVSEGWLRAADADAASGCDMGASIDFLDGSDNAIAGAGNETKGPFLDLATWNHGGTGVTYAGGAVKISVGFGSRSLCGCFLLDDATLHAQ